MTTIHRDVRTACSPERVWALLADLEAVQHYNPGARRAAIEGTQKNGVEARRSCDLSPKGRVVERVTHWEEGRAVGLEAVETPKARIDWLELAREALDYVGGNS